jgi:hypothetical protein
MTWKRWIALLLVTVVLITLAWLGDRALEAQSGQPGVLEIENVEIVSVLGSPPLSNVPSDISVGVRRLVYGAGGILEISYAGPVIYLVEEGELVVNYRRDGTMSLVSTGNGEQKTSLDTAADEVVLPAGNAIVSEDGRLGRTHNPSDEPATVLAIMLVPEDGGRASETGVMTAAPASDKDK